MMETFPWDRYTVLVLTLPPPSKELKGAFTSHGYFYTCDHEGPGREQM